MENVRIIHEYEDCKIPFLIPLKIYQNFKAFCDRQGWRMEPKLVIREIGTPHQGKQEVLISGTSYIGAFFIPENPILIIQPKVDAPAFVAMLQYVDESNIFFQDLFVEGLREDTNFVEFFISHFIKSTFSLLQRSFRRGYNSISHSLPSPKGRVDFWKTIQNRFQGSTLFACNFYQYNSNTLFHRIIKFTLLHIRELVPLKSVSDYFSTMHMLEGVDVEEFAPSEIEDTQFNRLDLPYREVIKLCKLILQNQIITLQKGVQLFPAFCFNAWEVFEIFIRKILQLHAPEEYYVEKKMYLTSHNEPIIPDIVYTHKTTNSHALVIDVKYKRQFQAPDYHQIHTYLAELHARKGVLLYPEDIKKPPVKDLSYEFFDFKRWMKEKKQYIETFVQYIHSLIHAPEAVV